MALIRTYATESQALHACRDEEVAIVLAGRPCTAPESFVERLRAEGEAFQAAGENVG